MFTRCPLIHPLLAFAAGIFCAAAMQPCLGPAFMPGPWALLLLPLGLIAAAAALRFRGVPGIFLAIGSLLLSGAGGLLQGAQASAGYSQDQTAAASTTGQPAWYTGRLHGRPAVNSRDTVLTVDLQLADTGRGSVPLPGGPRIRLSHPTAPHTADRAPLMAGGQQIRFFASLRRPTSFGNPGSFDYQRYLAIRGIRYTAGVKSGRLIQTLTPPKRDVASIVGHWVERMVRSHWGLPGDSGLQQSGALLVACLTGERRWIDDQETELLRHAGLGHLLAISGLHLGLLGLLFTLLLCGFGVPIRIRRLALILFFFAYHELCGATPSITRAAGTAVIFLAGGVLGLHSRPGNSLAAAGLSILFLNPLMLHDAGFQLSFAATLSILVLGRVFIDPQKAITPARLLSRLFMVSAAVFMGIAPLQAVLYHWATPAALLINPAAGLFLGLSLTAGLIFLASRWFCEILPGFLFLPLETTCGSAADVVDFAFGSIHWMAQRTAPFSFRVPTPSPAVCSAYYLLLAGAVLTARRNRSGRRRTVVLLLACSAPCLLLFSAAVGHHGLPGGAVRLTFLDVGQGDATIVECPGRRTLVLDGGAALPGGLDLGEMAVSPALWHRGIHRIEAVAVSHGHQDHAGGLASVIGNFRPRQILCGIRLATGLSAVRSLLQNAEKYGAGQFRLHRGMVTRWGDVEFIVLHPPPPDSLEDMDRGPNSNSLVLLLRHNSVKVLFSGDLEAEGEETLLGSPLSRLAARCQLLKVGHHGAPGSSSGPWLALVAPEIAVITAGRFNRFGHPDPSLGQRLVDAGCRRVHCTGRDGALTVVSDGHRLLFPGGRS
jgi:competence protein ComEC